MPHTLPCRADPDILPQEQLRKYITYAKQTCRPRLQQGDYEKIAQARKEPLLAIPAA